MRRPTLLILSFGLTLFAWLEAADGQLGRRRNQAPRAKLSASQEPPFYVGIPVTLYVEVTGFDPAQGQPECEAPKLDKGSLQFVTSDDSSSVFTQIINGRVSERRTVTYRFLYRFQADEPGNYTIPQFVVKQAGKEVRTSARRLTLQTIPQDPNLRVRLLIPEKPVFVGQKIEVTLEWWLGRPIQEHVVDYNFHCDLFDRTDLFRFIDVEPERGERALEIKAAGETIRLPYKSERRTFNNQAYTVITARREMIPLRGIELDLTPTSVLVDQATQYKRDLFGRRRASQTRKIAARDLPRKLVVQGVPVANRPPTFAGAIGSGFQLEVAADRTVVQVGDPIRLTMKLTGAGLLETAGAPRLGAPGNLAPGKFRTPADAELGGAIEEETKTFEAMVRILDESVVEVPAITYSWFDPGLEEYVSTQSQPIALRVRRGTVVTAEDVERNTETPTATEVDQPEQSGDSRPQFTLTGAELSLVQQPEVLLRDQRRVPGGQLTLLGLYAIPLLLLGAAVVSRRRADVDPTTLRRRKRLRELLTQVEAAGKMQARDGARTIAGALREMIAELPEAKNSDLEACIAECDAVIFAPQDSSSTLDAQLLERAQRRAREVVQLGGGA